jgi:hypothetical protein
MINDILEQRTSAAKQTDAAHVNIDALEQQIQKSAQALLAQQRPDGHWVFELEACGIISASRSMPSWNERSRSICAASRASTAAGRCSATAHSTSARR